MIKYLLLLFSLISGAIYSNAQRLILKGKINAGMTSESVEGIMLEMKSGDMTFTNSDGNFSIHYQPNDTVSFFLSGKVTSKFSVDSLAKIHELVLSLQTIRNTNFRTGKITYFPINDDTTTLNNVTVRTRNYHADSLKNRKEYKEAFNYTKPKLEYGKDWGFTMKSIYINDLEKLTETLNEKRKSDIPF